AASPPQSISSATAHNPHIAPLSPAANLPLLPHTPRTASPTPSPALPLTIRPTQYGASSPAACTHPRPHATAAHESPALSPNQHRSVPAPSPAAVPLSRPHHARAGHAPPDES